MCGIIGAISEVDITAGLNAIAHRGKDAVGRVNFGQFSLGHRRLAILDLDERSNQPFMYGNLAIVYNGELWNYKDLRSELIEAGYTFTTTGDTEVVAKSLLRWGVKAIEKFNGMFALGWTDGVSLWIARDKFGEVPIYYNTRNGLAFASEMKGLIACGLNDNHLLPCGTWLAYSNKEYYQHTYYSVPRNDIILPHDYAERLKALTVNAVEERQISDVPVCTLLSGGLDSSLVTAILAKTFPNIVAYTAVFNPKSKDLLSARALASDLGIKLVEVTIPAPTRTDIQATIFCIENYLKTQVEIAYPCIKLAEVISKDGFKVTFSGDGSDEMFGSYRFAYYGIKDKGYTPYIRELYNSLSYKNYIRNNKAFMAHSVEVRLPFANTDLVEYVLNLPERVVYNAKNEKHLLKTAMQSILPDFITHRRKIGFQDGLGIKDAFKSVCEPSYYKHYFEMEFGNKVVA